MTLLRLDLSLFTNGNATDSQHFASDLLESLRRHGFVKIINHGIPDHTVAEMFEWVRVHDPRPSLYPFLTARIWAIRRINHSSGCRQTKRILLLTVRDLSLSEVGAKSELRTVLRFTGKVYSSLM